jgi:hypothetical protein
MKHETNLVGKNLGKFGNVLMPHALELRALQVIKDLVLQKGGSQE